MTIRNGSVEGIKKIISYLNEAKLDPKTGMCSLISSLCGFLVSQNPWKPNRCLTFEILGNNHE